MLPVNGLLSCACLQIQVCPGMRMSVSSIQHSRQRTQVKLAAVAVRMHRALEGAAERIEVVHHGQRDGAGERSIIIECLIRLAGLPRGRRGQGHARPLGGARVHEAARRQVQALPLHQVLRRAGSRGFATGSASTAGKTGTRMLHISVRTGVSCGCCFLLQAHSLHWNCLAWH